MGDINKATQVKLFFACTYNANFNIQEFYKKIEKEYNKISIKSPIINFHQFTDYYNKEMGYDLKKQIISIVNNYNLDDLLDIKIKTNELENTYKIKGNRQINIDPGYLTEAKVILFTTKNNIHRIYIGNGLYAEITLTYRKGSYDINPMTYRDYKEKEFINYFNKLRIELRNKE